MALKHSHVDHLNTDLLKALPDDGPVAMLNLMRFREHSLDGNGSGWDAYLRYSALTIKLIKKVGGTIFWAGEAQAVALGVPDAHRWDYVALVRYGLGVPQDYAEAERLYVRVAERGGRLAQFNQGIIYSQGWNLPQDHEKAEYWYRRAAELGEPQAQFNLGVVCIKGLGKPRDYDEAIVWYQRSASQGYARAQFNLATMYADGIGVSESKVEAYKWFSLAIMRLAVEDQDFIANARRLRAEIALMMTAAEIEEAERLADDWRPTLELSSSD